MESSISKTSKKALISLRRLTQITKDLPSPSSHTERSIERKCGSLTLKFEKIIYTNSEGVQECRWSYNARLVI